MKSIKEINNWIVNNQDLIKKVIYINRIGRPEDRDDLIQDANLFLIDRAKYYDPNKGNKYSTYILKALKKYLKARARKMNDATHKPNNFYEYYGIVRKFCIDYSNKNRGEIPAYEIVKKEFPSISESLFNTILEVGENKSFGASIVSVEELRRKNSGDLDIFNSNEYDIIDDKLDKDIEFKKLILSTKCLQPNTRQRVLNFVKYAYDNDVIDFKKYAGGEFNNKYYAEHQAIRMAFKRLKKNKLKYNGRFNNIKIMNSTLDQCYNEMLKGDYYVKKEKNNNR